MKARDRRMVLLAGGVLLLGLWGIVALAGGDSSARGSDAAWPAPGPGGHRPGGDSAGVSSSARAEIELPSASAASTPLIEVPAGLELRVRPHDGGRSLPVLDFEVRMIGTDPAGNLVGQIVEGQVRGGVWSRGGLAPDRYWIRVEVPNKPRLAASPWQMVDLSDGALGDPVQVIVPPRVERELLVCDAADEPVAFAVCELIEVAPGEEVTLVSEVEDAAEVRHPGRPVSTRVLRGVTGEDGRLMLRGAAGRGRYVLRVVPREHAPVLAPVFDLAREPLVVYLAM